jgi:excisionase family DNA binding protein
MPKTDEKTKQRSLLGIEDVAELLGVGVRHVRRLVAERRIPYLKWGHLLRFDPAEIDSWLDGVRWPAGADAIAMPGGQLSGRLPRYLSHLAPEAVVPRREDGGVGRQPGR